MAPEPTKAECHSGKRKDRDEPIAEERSPGDKHPEGDPPGDEERERRPRDQALGVPELESVHDRSGESDRDAQDEEEAGQRVDEHGRGLTLGHSTRGPMATFSSLGAAVPRNPRVA